MNIVKLIVLCLLSALPCKASASLIEVSDTLVYDDVTSQYWYNNISEFSGGAGGVDPALQWITTNYYGLKTWHLASEAECTSLVAGTTIADFLKYFAPTGAGVFGYADNKDLGIGNYKYWAGSTDSYGTLDGASWHYPLDLFYTRVNYDLNDSAQITPLSMEYGKANGPQWLKLEEVGAWVTAQGPAPGPAPVPEPSTVLLIGTGMAGLAGIRQLKRKKELNG